MLGVFTVVSYRRARLFSVYTLVIFGFALGWWRGAMYMSEVKFLDSINGAKVTLVGRAANDGVYNRYGAMSFDMDFLLL